MYRPIDRGLLRKSLGTVPPDKPLILFLSRLIPRKGADILIDAFAQSCPTGRLVIAGPEGEPGYLAYLKAHIENSGAVDRIVFTRCTARFANRGACHSCVPQRESQQIIRSCLGLDLDGGSKET